MNIPSLRPGIIRVWFTNGNFIDVEDKHREELLSSITTSTIAIVESTDRRQHMINATMIVNMETLAP